MENLIGLKRTFVMRHPKGTKLKKEIGDEQYFSGADSYDNKQYDLAVQDFSDAVSVGNAKAENGLALCYFRGQGVEENATEAFKLILQAAEQGLIVAQYNCGIAYENGVGVEQDLEQALRWYREAGMRGYAEAQCAVGDCYRKGCGVEINRMAAIQWYILAVKQGSKRARAGLERCCEPAKDVEVHPKNIMGL